MSHREYAEVVKSVVGEGFDPEVAECNLLAAIPNLNSLTLVELVQKLELRFNFQADMSMISPETFESLSSLKRFVEQSR